MWKKEGRRSCEKKAKQNICFAYFLLSATDSFPLLPFSHMGLNQNKPMDCL